MGDDNIFTADNVKTIKLEPAPYFTGGSGGPSLATIYMSHYQRMMAVVAAARSGDSILMKLALAHYDEHGSSDNG